MQEKNGFHVTHLNIAKTKRKFRFSMFGIDKCPPSVRVKAAAPDRYVIIIIVSAWTYVNSQSVIPSGSGPTAGATTFPPTSGKPVSGDAAKCPCCMPMT